MSGLTGKERFIKDPGTAEAFNRLAGDLRAVLPWRACSRPQAVTFPTKNTSVEVLHGMGVVPDFVIADGDAHICRTPGKAWTTTSAFLEADADHAHAVVVFAKLKEDISRA